MRRIAFVLITAVTTVVMGATPRLGGPRGAWGHIARAASARGHRGSANMPTRQLPPGPSASPWALAEEGRTRAGHAQRPRLVRQPQPKHNAERSDSPGWRNSRAPAES